MSPCFRGLWGNYHASPTALMLVEISEDDLYFQTISEKGQTIDYGIIRKGENDTVVGTSGARGARGRPIPRGR